MKKLIESLKNAIPLLEQHSGIAGEIKIKTAELEKLTQEVSTLKKMVDDQHFLIENEIKETKARVIKMVESSNNKIEDNENASNEQLKRRQDESEKRELRLSNLASELQEKDNLIRQLHAEAVERDRKSILKEKDIVSRETRLSDNEEKFRLKLEDFDIKLGHFIHRENEVKTIEKNIDKEKKDIKAATEHVNSANESIQKERAEFIKYKSGIENNIKEAEKTIENAKKRWFELNKLNDELNARELALDARKKAIDDKEKSVMAALKEINK
jgi:hypothetical protein